jgi:hypothetical protein
MDFRYERSLKISSKTVLRGFVRGGEGQLKQLILQKAFKAGLTAER